MEQPYILNKNKKCHLKMSCRSNSHEKSPLIENRIVRKLLSVNELAKLLSVSPKTIYGWHYRGEIKAVKVGPRLIRFDQNEVELWISKQRE